MAWAHEGFGLPSVTSGLWAWSKKCPKRTTIIHSTNKQPTKTTNKLCFFAGKMNGGCLRALDLTNGGRPNPPPGDHELVPSTPVKINKLL